MHEETQIVPVVSRLPLRLAQWQPGGLSRFWGESTSESASVDAEAVSQTASLGMARSATAAAEAGVAFALVRLVLAPLPIGPTRR